MVSKKLALIGILLISGCGWAPGDGNILSRIEEAYGGPEAIAKMNVYRVVGRLSKVMGGGEGWVVRDYRAPGGLRVELTYPTHRELRILDGSLGWRGVGSNTRPAEGMLLDSMLYHHLRSDLPGVLLRNRDRLVDRGRQEREGATFRVLDMPWSDTLTMRYWIDPSSYRVIRADGTLKAGPMVLEFATEYGDFRKVEGVLFPFIEANFASGNRVATTTVEEIVFSPEDLGPFSPSAAEAGLQEV